MLSVDAAVVLLLGSCYICQRQSFWSSWSEW